MTANVETMAYFGKAPWWVGIENGTATELAGLADKATMIEAAGMDWDVVKAPLTLPDGRPLGTGHVALTRSDTGAGLAVVKDSYQPLSPSVVFDVMDDVVDDGGANYETAGVLSGGKLVWALMRLPRTIQIKGDPSATNPYLLGLAGNDGHHGFTVKPTAIRVVCSNTANAALAGRGDKYVIRHTRNATLRIGEVRNALRMTFAYLDSFEAVMNDLTRDAMSAPDFIAFTEKLIPVKDDEGDRALAKQAREAMAALFVNSATLNGVPFTYYRAYQAVAEYADHYKPFRATKGNTVEDNRAYAILAGSSSVIKDRALALLAPKVAATR